TTGSIRVMPLAAYPPLTPTPTFYPPLLADPWFGGCSLVAQHLRIRRLPPHPPSNHLPTLQRLALRPLQPLLTPQPTPLHLLHLHRPSRPTALLSRSKTTGRTTTSRPFSPSVSGIRVLQPSQSSPSACTSRSTGAIRLQITAWRSITTNRV